MSFSNHITKWMKSKAYFRRLVVRAIEDVIILFGINLGIAFVCALFSICFRWMGVA